MTPSRQLLFLFVVALPVASIAWTFTHEEVFRELHEYCVAQSKECRRIYTRKFFYLFTCEYCFSHYVAALFLAITRLKLLYPDWRGYLVAGLSLVWVANIYIGLFARLRLDVKKTRVEVSAEEQTVRAQAGANAASADGSKNAREERPREAFGRYPVSHR